MKTEFEQYLEQTVDNDNTVKQAMNYSLLAGGKRIRPLLLLNLLKDFKCDYRKAFPIAAAIEMIHTYSLIHDDLPAMDNDDLRRGKPTCHVEYGEANAILAGDGLLTYSFKMVSESDYDAEKKIETVRLLADAAGCDGMIKGQCLDLAYENCDVSFEMLKEMDHQKTGQLLTVPFMIATVLSDHKEYDEIFRQVGMDLGLAFQIQDDILDVEKTAEQTGKSASDIANSKSTYVSLLSVDKAKDLADKLFECISDTMRSQDNDFENTFNFIKEISNREF